LQVGSSAPAHCPAVAAGGNSGSEAAAAPALPAPSELAWHHGGDGEADMHAEEQPSCSCRCVIM
jgi:hypothetical protein